MLKRTITNNGIWVYDYDVEAHVQLSQRILPGGRLKIRQFVTIRDIKEKSLVKLIS